MPKVSHCFVACVLFVHALSAAPVVSPQDPAILARLQAAEREQTLTDPAMKPWHLRISVQLFNEKGEPKETGSIEEWWAAPTSYRQTFEFPSYKATLLMTPTGQYVTDKAGAAPYELEELLRLVTHPFDTAAELQNASAVVREEKLGPTKADCIVLDKKIKRIPYPPLGLFPTYCLQQGSNTLLMRSEISEISALSAIGGFRGKHYPVDLRLLINNVRAGTEHVDKLEIIDAAASELTNTDGLTNQNEVHLQMASEMAQALLLKQVQPIYPGNARDRGASGVVVLEAKIGTDGRLHKISLLSAPNAELAVAAAVAVRQWEYKPAMVNGNPAEFRTTIQVIFQPEP
jgi:TonB family protein